MCHLTHMKVPQGSGNTLPLKKLFKIITGYQIWRIPLSKKKKFKACGLFQYSIIGGKINTFLMSNEDQLKQKYSIGSNSFTINSIK